MKYRSLYLLLPVLVISFYTAKAADTPCFSSGGIVKSKDSVDLEESLVKLQETFDKGHITKELALVIANNKFDSTVIPDQHKVQALYNPDAHALVRSTNKVTQWTEANELYRPATACRPAVATRTKAPKALRDQIKGLSPHDEFTKQMVAPGALLNEIEDRPYLKRRLYMQHLKDVRALPTSDTLLQKLMNNNETALAGNMSFVGGQLLSNDNEIIEDLSPKVQLYIAALHHQYNQLKEQKDELKRIKKILGSDEHNLCPSPEFGFYIDALATWYSDYKMTDEERKQDLSTEHKIQRLFSQQELPTEIRGLLHLYIQSVKNKPKSSWPFPLLPSSWFSPSEPEDARELLSIKDQLVNIEQEYKQYQQEKNVPKLKLLGEKRNQLKAQQEILLTSIKEKAIAFMKEDLVEYRFRNDLVEQAKNLELLTKGEQKNIEVARDCISHLLLHMTAYERAKGTPAVKAIKELFAHAHPKDIMIKEKKTTLKGIGIDDKMATALAHRIDEMVALMNDTESYTIEEPVKQESYATVAAKKTEVTEAEKRDVKGKGPAKRIRRKKLG